MRPNWSRYLLSLADELKSQAKRVRDLIGDRHWLTDGHQKEFLLIDLLLRHLPSGVHATRGFVISSTNPQAISKEQDVLIIDTFHEAPLFNQGGVAVVFPRQVLASISVKTTMDSETVEDVVNGLSSVASVAAEDADSGDIWYGGYFFSPSEAVTRNPASILSCVEDFLRNVDHRLVWNDTSTALPSVLCTTEDFAYRFDRDKANDPEGIRMYGRKCSSHATAIFLANVLDHVTVSRGFPSSDFADFADTVQLEHIDTRFVAK